MWPNRSKIVQYFTLFERCTIRGDVFPCVFFHEYVVIVRKFLNAGTENFVFYVSECCVVLYVCPRIRKKWKKPPKF